MKGSPDVIATLQKAVGQEASLNEQYRLDARSVKYLGLKKIKSKTEQFGDDISDYRRALLDRIYLLEGSPSYQIASPQEQSGVLAMFQNQLRLEMAIIAPYEEAVQVAMKALDDTTRNLFEHLLKWHEEHVCWLEKQIKIITSIGEPEYIAEKL